MSERHQRVKLISHPRRSCRQFMPEVAFDTVNITFSAIFIDPNGVRLHVGLVIGRLGQTHTYLIALAVHDNDGVAFVWGGFLDGRDVIGGPMNIDVDRFYPKNLRFIGRLDGRSLNLLRLWLHYGSRNRRAISSK